MIFARVSVRCWSPMRTHTPAIPARLLLQRLARPCASKPGSVRLQQVIVESGAREAVESMINEYYERALEALRAEITDEGRVGLTALADAAVRREF